MDKNIAAFLDPTAFTISVMFKASESKAAREYTYLCNLPGVKAGDWVVVDAPDFDGAGPYADSSRMTMVDIEQVIGNGTLAFSGVPKVVIVTKVDDTVNIEPNAPKQYKWVVAKLELAAYYATLKRNAKITETVSESYRKSMRRSFSERVLADMDESSRIALLELIPSAPVRPETPVPMAPIPPQTYTVDEATPKTGY